MREILFRGKREDNGEWVSGNLFIPDREDTPTQICIGTNVIRITYDVTPATVGQYTGLTDKNGKRIFEGDIVLDHYYNELGVVTFCQGCFDSGIYKYNGWVVKRPDGTVEHGELVIYDDNVFEVIGNIHDNPELLEGSVGNESKT